MSSIWAPGLPIFVTVVTVAPPALSIFVNVVTLRPPAGQSSYLSGGGPADSAVHHSLVWETNVNPLLHERGVAHFKRARAPWPEAQHFLSLSLSLSPSISLLLERMERASVIGNPSGEEESSLAKAKARPHLLRPTKAAPSQARLDCPCLTPKVQSKWEKAATARSGRK